VTEVVVDGETLTPEDVEAVARDGATVRIADESREDVRRSRERVADVLESGEAVYGVNTGFGQLVDTQIPREDLQALQTNLLRSHAAGAGHELEREAVRALMLTRLNALVKGYSGIREVVVDLLTAMLNEGVHPVVPSRGSLGASGDLARSPTRVSCSSEKGLLWWVVNVYQARRRSLASASNPSRWRRKRGSRSSTARS